MGDYIDAYDHEIYSRILYRHALERDPVTAAEIAKMAGLTGDQISNIKYVGNGQIHADINLERRVRE
ncbi:TPA: hypothetical protein HA239_06010 [Candidatus Woesearchaeota archaeon]|nr:hypothetical protein QT06_C0001G1304 [archaeon GW2011_AR15]MBS3104238.1 hypothetical protein [Candidatus Woesearchaeota archaeon]HIH41931.1 hypothetical protein [Candidatus Woesearchaeota archaeon]